MAKFTKYNENQEIDGNIQSNGSSATTVSSIAFGLTNLASGNYSQAFGSNTQATGNNSHASGQNSIASGNVSFVHGSGSTASGTNTVVLGANITGTANNTTYLDGLNIKTIAGSPSIVSLGLDASGFVVSAATAVDIYTTGFTFNPATYILTGNNNNGSGFTVDLALLASDMTITGGTYSSVTGIATFTNNTGGTFGVTGFLTGMTDTFVTGFTYAPSTNTLTIKQNAGQPDLSVSINSMTGLTVNGTLSATTIVTNNFTANNFTGTTISATTYLGLPLDVYITGATYNAGTAIFTNNLGGTFNLTGLYTGYTAPTMIYVTGGTYNPATGVETFTNTTGGTFTIGGLYTGYTAPMDVYTTGFTFNPGTYDLTGNRNDGGSYTTNLAILASDMTITGGTYSQITGIATFVNNTGGTFGVSGFLTGMTDTFTTGFTYNNNVITIQQNAGQVDKVIVINTMTGLTINGTLSMTGATNTANIATVNSTNIYTDTISATTGNIITVNSTTINGGTISATTYLGLPLDVYVTGGTYNNSTGITTFTNNAGGTFNVTGYYTGYTAPTDVDVYVSGGTYSGGIVTFTNTSGGTFIVSGITSLNKYVATTSLTGGVTYTVPHNLGTTDILIQFKDLIANDKFNLTVDNYQLNSVDITTVTSVASARIMIIGL